MTEYRIVCTEQEPCNADTSRAHIVAVGTGNEADSANQRWLLSEVVAALNTGDRFYTIGTSTGKRAEVETYNCGNCKTTHIRSNPDSTTDNNLDELRICSWTS